MSELLIKNGRVIDPANGVDKQCDVLIVDGDIAVI
jgi:predicted amidohydrolase